MNDSKHTLILPGLPSDSPFYRAESFKTANPAVVLKAEIPENGKVRRLFWRVDPTQCKWFMRQFNQWNPIPELCSREFIEELSKKYDNVHLIDFTRAMRIDSKGMFDELCKKFTTLSDIRAYEHDLRQQVLDMSRVVPMVQDTYYSYEQ